MSKPSYTPLGDGWVYGEIPSKTNCKHGQGPCDKCGTSDRADVKHTTISGKGRVAQALKKAKK